MIQIKNDNIIRNQLNRSLNRLPDLSDWRPGSEFVKSLQGMNEPPYIHRKAWEYATCVTGLFKLGAISPSSRGLGVAAGYERPLYYLTNHCAEIVATDLYNSPNNEGKPDMLTNPEKYAYCSWVPSKLKVLQMDATNLAFSSDSFDFCFSLSSIEHFGPRLNTEKAMIEMHRVLKPGGICCITTELILNEAIHDEYFTVKELNDLIINANGFGLVGGDLDLSIAKSLYDYPLVLGEENVNVSPHIVLNDDGVIFTSCSIFLKKALC